MCANKFPDRLFIQITDECNAKCRFCSFWHRKDPETKLSITEKLRFIEKYMTYIGDQNKLITLTGGESFLYPEQVFKIADFCNNNNIQCNVNTNGLLLADIIRRNNIKKILDSGLKITISIDSHRAEIHNYLRNTANLFENLMFTIEMLNKYRHRYKSKHPITLWVQSILGSWNIYTIAEHISFFKNLGVDGLLFQPIQYTLGLEHRIDWYKSWKYFPQKDSYHIIHNLVNICKDDIIINSIDEVKSWESYFKNPDRLSENHCYAYKHNLYIDIEGDVSFCGFYPPIPKNKIGNILVNTIDEILYGKNALLEKQKIRKCKKGCLTAMCNVDWE